MCGGNFPIILSPRISQVMKFFDEPEGSQAASHADVHRRLPKRAEKSL